MEMNRKIIKAGLKLIIASVIAGQTLIAEASADYRSGLDAITNFANANCETVSQTGDNSSLAYKGQLQAGISGLFKKLADVGASGSVEASEQRYSGMLQQDLSSALKDVRACRERVIDRLMPLIDKLSEESVPRIAQLLLPGSNKNLNNPCSSVLNPGDLTLLLGSNGFATSHAKSVILNVKGRDLISVIRHKDGAIGLSIDVISTDGDYLAKVVDNLIEVNIDNYLSIEKISDNHIFIKSKDKTTYLDFDYINKNVAKLAGVIKYHGQGVAIGKENAYIDGKSFSGNCIRDVFPSVIIN